jgi:hypothetical protein
MGGNPSQANETQFRENVATTAQIASIEACANSPQPAIIRDADMQSAFPAVLRLTRIHVRLSR